MEPQVRQLVRRGLQRQPSAADRGKPVVAGNANLLGRGFAVGTSSLNTYANQCNDIISAEALMMTKEILTERHGPIRYTIGNGGSAGTMQQHLITEAYPGLLNGIATSLLTRTTGTRSRVVRLHPALALLRAAERGTPFCRVPPGLRPSNPLFSTAADRQKVWGSNPAAPDNLCGTKIGFTLTELVADQPVRLLRPRRTATVALACREQPDGDTVYEPGLPEEPLRSRTR